MKYVLYGLFALLLGTSACNSTYKMTPTETAELERLEAVVKTLHDSIRKETIRYGEFNPKDSTYTYDSIIFVTSRDKKWTEFGNGYKKTYYEPNLIRETVAEDDSTNEMTTFIWGTDYIFISEKEGVKSSKGMYLYTNERIRTDNAYNKTRRKLLEVIRELDEDLSSFWIEKQPKIKINFDGFQ